MKVALLLFACFTSFVACGVQPSNASAASASLRGPVAVALPHPRVAAGPLQLPVGFSHISPGTYIVHLHAICSGSQGYHLAYLPDLVVGSAHTGQILVPTVDFGRGWCVIVYADAARSIVLVTQLI